ncbi:hypothetical protein L6R52_33250 [Myxococcota bacterium]|nr:hypothetical protein [Myxococcota bacterium]
MPTSIPRAADTMQRRSSVALALAGLAALACGGEPEPKRTLSLASTYDTIGVARRLAEGSEPLGHVVLFVTFDGLVASGGRVIGTVGRRGEGSAASLTGTFDLDTGQLAFDSVDGALTSTLTERIDELGGRADDVAPEDGITDELVGYLRTRRGTLVTDGTLLGISRTDGRPRAIDDAKVTIREESTGAVRITAEPGAAIPAAGIDIFRFRLSKRSPDYDLVQARDDGSFDVVVDGIREDTFVLRLRTIGVAGEARAFGVD